MDLAVHLRVLSRHRVLAILGFGAAIVLATLSYVKVSPDGVSYRQNEKWQSITRLSAAQDGNPFRPAGPASVDTTTFAVLATQYANSDGVRRLLRETGKINGEIDATTATTESGSFLPFIGVAGIAKSPALATSLSRRAATAISQFVERQQVANDVPPGRRVTLQIVSRPEKPELLEGRKKATPLFLFLALASLTIGGIYAVENLRRSPSSELESALADGAAQADADPRAVQGEPDRPVAVPLAERGSRRKPDEVARPTTLYLDSAGGEDGRSGKGQLRRAEEH